MNSKDKRSLWTDSKRSRYFLIPDNQKLVRGSFIILTLTGIKKKVTQTAITSFEISETQAKAHLQAQIDRAMTQAKTAFSNLASFSIQTSAEIPSEQTPLVSSIISSLLGVTPEELLNNPEAAETTFVNIYTELKEFLSESTSKNPTQAEAARERIHSLREILQAQGINISEDIDKLPSQLQKVLSSSNIEGYLQEIATKLQDLIGEINQFPDTVEQKIDETIKSLSKDLFIDEEKHQEEKKIQEYRTSAQDAIAASFKSRYSNSQADEVHL
jgi:hypothetical protein